MYDTPRKGAHTAAFHATVSGAMYARNGMPSSFGVSKKNGLAGEGVFTAESGGIARRIAVTREWLRHMNEELHQAQKRHKMELESTSLVFSVLRASSVLLTAEAGRDHAPRRHFCYSLLSFLDGTPFLTARALCDYNTAVAEMLSDDHLELMRKYVFDYDEAAFAELLYADEVAPEMRLHMRCPSGEVPTAVQEFNQRSRRALERLFAAPSGLANATMRVARHLSIVTEDVDGYE